MTSVGFVIDCTLVQFYKPFQLNSSSQIYESFHRHLADRELNPSECLKQTKFWSHKSTHKLTNSPGTHKSITSKTILKGNLTKADKPKKFFGLFKVGRKANSIRRFKVWYYLTVWPGSVLVGFLTLEVFLVSGHAVHHTLWFMCNTVWMASTNRPWKATVNIPSFRMQSGAWKAVNLNEREDFTSHLVSKVSNSLCILRYDFVTVHSDGRCTVFSAAVTLRPGDHWKQTALGRAALRCELFHCIYTAKCDSDGSERLVIVSAFVFFHLLEILESELQILVSRN